MLKRFIISLFMIAGLVTLACAADENQNACKGDPNKWQQLFDGKDLTGWKHVGPGGDTVEDGLIKRLNLMAAYKTKRLTQARFALASNSKFVSEKGGMISITVKDGDPHRAAQIANAYVDELHDINSRLIIGEAGVRRNFFSQQLALEKDRLTEAEIALRKPRGTEEYREALRHVLLEAERTSSLVEELLSLARADSGRENLCLRLLDLRSVIAETADEWHRLVHSRNLQFKQTIADYDMPVLADRRAVQQLLAILLDNAVKYTPPPGVVELLLQVRSETAVLTVRDSGIGIAEEDQSKIFERFYRVDKARSRELGGSGIGLAIAEWIVQQHRGSIAVQSSIDNGSSFIVSVPLQTNSGTVDIRAESVVPAKETQT